MELGLAGKKRMPNMNQNGLMYLIDYQMMTISMIEIKFFVIPHFRFLGTPSVTVQTRDSFERGIRSLDASRAYHCWAKIPNVTFDDQFYIDVADRDYELNLEFSNKMGYKTLPNRIDVESMLRRRKNRNS